MVLRGEVDNLCQRDGFSIVFSGTFSKFVDIAAPNIFTDSFSIILEIFTSFVLTDVLDLFIGVTIFCSTISYS